MKTAAVLLVFALVSPCAFSQQIHTYGEISSMIKGSKLTYEVFQIDKIIGCKDYSENLNPQNCYRITTGSGTTTYEYKPNYKAAPLFDQAEEYYRTNNSERALQFYLLALDADSSLANVMTYIGQIHGIKGDNPEAISWFKKAVSKNYIDYTAHWLLAKAYLEIEDYKNAVDEIAIARILNRNDRRIKESMAKILERAGRNPQDWCFVPQIELNKTDDGRVQVAVEQQWVGYGMAKALWMFEPGYRESMGVTKGYFSTLEEKECLTTLIASMDVSKIQQDAQLRTLKAADTKNQLENYILYEIVLPDNPSHVYQLPEQTILEIKDYILNIRNSK